MQYQFHVVKHKVTVGIHEEGHLQDKTRSSLLDMLHLESYCTDAEASYWEKWARTKKSHSPFSLIYLSLVPFSTQRSILAK